MKLARFREEHAKRVAINPANVRLVREPDNPKGPTYIELVNGRVAVMAAFDEVVSVLQGIDAVPVVEPEPTDLEMAINILDLLSQNRYLDWDAVDKLIGVPMTADWAPTSAALTALAARLRGRAP